MASGKHRAVGSAAWLVVLLTACLSSGARASTAPSLEIRTEPLVDFYFMVRALAAGDGAVPEPLAESVQAARTLGAALPGPRAWGVLDGQAVRCRKASDLEAAFTRLPETFVASTGDTLHVLPQSLALAKTLEAAEPWFLETVWPEHARTLAAATDTLQELLLPREDACFHSVTAALAMGHPVVVIPVYLVAQAPPPGGVTLRGPTGAVSMVGVDGITGFDLVEVVLHEAIHALDVATAQEPTVLQRLRQSLQEGGVPRTDPRYRDIPHAVIFLQAAATVREVLDPEHRDYGETHGAYDRMKKTLAVVRPLWEARLEGSVPVEVAIRRIVKEVTGR